MGPTFTMRLAYVRGLQLHFPPIDPGDDLADETQWTVLLADLYGADGSISDHGRSHTCGR